MTAANSFSALFAMLAAFFWFTSTVATVKADPEDDGFRIVTDSGVDILKTARLQVRWNRWAAAAASLAAAAQAVAAFMSV